MPGSRATDRVAEAASDGNVDIDMSHFPAGTKTAADAADAIGCEVSAIVKSLVFVVDTTPVVALIPGDRRLDTSLLSTAAGGGTARRATLDQVRAATGYAAGGTPPFGYTKHLEVFADPSLERNEPVWAAGGTPSTVFPISVADLIRLSGATWARLTSEP